MYRGLYAGDSVGLLIPYMFLDGVLHEDQFGLALNSAAHGHVKACSVRDSGSRRSANVCGK